MAATARHVLLIAGFLVATALVGCSGAGEDGSPTIAGKVEVPTTTAPLAGDRGAAAQAGLRLADFPAGWRESKADDDGGRKVSDCAAIAVVRQRLTGEADSAEFQESDGAAEVKSTVTLWVSATDADAYLDAWQDASVPDCAKTLVNQNLKRSRSDLAEASAEVLSTDFGNLSVEPAGDRSVGVELTVNLNADGIRATLYSDYVVVRVGRATAGFNFVDVFSPMGDPRDELVDAVVTRLRAIG